MEKIRIKNWSVIIIFVILYFVLKYLNLDGFWSGVSIGIAAGLFFTELYWIIRQPKTKEQSFRD